MSAAKTREQILDIIKNIEFPEREFSLFDKGDGFLLQVSYWEEDIDHPELGPQKQMARKWYVSPYATETEVVETAFKAIRTSMEHVVREHFTYKGRRICSPHFNVNAMMRLCDDGDFDLRD